MSGHCEYHNFERATDVCDMCFGDLCESCVVMLPGRRHAVCTECAIQVSGVRKSARPVVRGDKSTVKARRQRYAADPSDDKYFQFFTSSTESESDSSPVDAEADAHGRRRGRFRFGRGRSSDSGHGVDVAAAISSSGDGDERADPVGDGDGDPEAESSGAVSRLNRLRGSLHHGGREPSDDDLVDGPITDRGQDAVERSVIPEDRPDKASVTSTTESAADPTEEPAGDPPSLRSLASRITADRPSPIDQLLHPQVLDPATGLDDHDARKLLEPADLSVDPFDLGGSRPIEAPSPQNRPTTPQRPPTSNQLPHTRQSEQRPPTTNHPPQTEQRRPTTNQPPHTRQSEQRPPSTNHPPQTEQRPRETDAEGRWIPPVLRGVGPASPEDEAAVPRRRQ